MNTDHEKTAAALAHIRECADCQAWFAAALAAAEQQS